MSAAPVGTQASRGAADATAPPARPGDPALEWSYNPWRERPARAATALAALLLCVAIAATAGLPALVAAALCVACAATLASGLLPISCRLDAEGASRRSAGIAERRPWGALRRAVRTPAGVLLSPFARRHWLEPYRALFLPLPPGRPPLAADVERILAAHGL